jgi:hypothetical protein
MTTLTHTVNKSLVPFTGYYAMDIAAGAFLSIDTSEAWSTSAPISSVTVTVSTDGAASKTYPIDDTTTFDGRTLIIPDVLHIVFERKYNNGILTNFSGKIYGKDAKGNTRFNPLTLSTFIGSYLEIPTGKNVLVITESGVEFDFGSGLQPITQYAFNPLMFVLSFNGPTGQKYTLMMGTAGSMGLAVYIQYGTTGSYAVTILP